MNNRLILYLVSFAAFLGPFTQSIYTPIIPEIIEDFQTSPYLVNLTISIFTFFMALMQMAYGPLTDTKGRRKILLIGIFLYIAASLGCYYSQSIQMLLVFRAFQAIGIAAGSVVAVTVIGDIFEGKHRGNAMGTFQMMVALGPVVGPVVGGFLGGLFNFHTVFLALVLVGVLVFVGNYLFLKETRPEITGGHHFGIGDFLVVLKDRIGSSIVLLGFIQYYAFYNFLVFIPGILSEQYGLTAEQKGMAFLPMTLLIVFGSFLGGRLQETFEGRKVVVGTSYLNVAAILLFLWVSPLSLPLLIGSTILFGLFLGMSLPVQTTLLTSVFLSNRATAVGVYNFFRYMGMACGPLLGSVLLSAGGYNAVYGFIVVVFLGVTLLLNKQFLGRKDARVTNG